MANNKLILRSLNSGFPTPFQDITLGSVLSHADLDNNFIYLKSELIHSGTTSGTILSLSKIGGGEINIDLADIITSGLTDNYTTGSTLIGNQLYFNTVDSLSAYTVDLTPLVNSSTAFSSLTDTIIVSPVNGDYVVYSGNNVINISEKNIVFSATSGGQTVFNILTDIPLNSGNSKLYVNGVKQTYTTDYIITGGTNVVWVSAKHNIEINDTLEISYL